MHHFFVLATALRLVYEHTIPCASIHSPLNIQLLSQSSHTNPSTPWFCHTMNVSLVAALVFVTTTIAPALSIPLGYVLCSLIILQSRLIFFVCLAFTGSLSSPGIDPELLHAIPAHQIMIGRRTEMVKLSSIEWTFSRPPQGPPSHSTIDKNKQCHNRGDRLTIVVSSIVL